MHLNTAAYGFISAKVNFSMAAIVVNKSVKKLYTSTVMNK